MTSSGVSPTTKVPAWAEQYPSLPYVAPFIAFMAMLLIGDQLTALGSSEFPLRVFILGAVIYFCSWHVLDFRVRLFAPTILVGILVFAIWIAPDQLIPGYRNHWLFQNSITGQIKSSLPQGLRDNSVVLIFRFLRAVIIVPIVEELFWRGWLMRWLINSDFRKVALGAYSLSAVLITAVLFASEHGPYWEVGLLAGLIYNLWMVKTKSLGDLILAHAITNAALSAYVIATASWQYWL